MHNFFKLLWCKSSVVTRRVSAGVKGLGVGGGATNKSDIWYLMEGYCAHVNIFLLKKYDKDNRKANFSLQNQALKKSRHIIYKIQWYVCFIIILSGKKLLFSLINVIWLKYGYNLSWHDIFMIHRFLSNSDESS